MRQPIPQVWKTLARVVLPNRVYEAIRLSRGGTPRPGQVRFGDLRRLSPLSHDYGYDRGLPIDRYYIEQFLEAHQDCIRGRVLEIADNAYTVRFGGNRVTHSDVLAIDTDNPHATIVADLEVELPIESGLYDCIICTQTLQYILELRTAIRTLRRILKPTGTILVTVPGIAPIPTTCWSDRWCWCFAKRAATELFTEQFGSVEVVQYGNVLTATGFVQGLASEELRPEELSAHDPQYSILFSVKAKP